MTPPMKKKRTRSKLGRGLSALVDQSSIGAVQVVSDLGAAQNTNKIQSVQDSAIARGEQVLELDVTSIGPNPHQPRRSFDEESLEELAQSIAEHGLMQPIVVRVVHDGGGERYELIAGERRWRATCRTGKPQIRAVVLDVDDAQSAQLALIENIQREDLNPIERAHGFVLLNERFGMTQEHISRTVGISRSSVANFLRLIELDDEIQSMIASGVLGAGHGKALLSCKDVERRLLLARQAVEEEWTVRILEKAAAAQSIHNESEKEANSTNPSVVNIGQPTRVESVLHDLEKRLGEWLGTNVKLKTDQSGTKGSITIEFYDLDHFDGLMNRLGVGGDDEVVVS